ncbi:hypothetical protein MHM582_0496 [Microbacterium sp. HM58-2]|nr:hypothetical protein MHM582_0496 [Microbacterium sp. HM58-2]
MSIRKGGGAWGAGEPSDESQGRKRYHAPSLGPAWSIRVIAAAVEAEEQAAAARLAAADAQVTDEEADAADRAEPSEGTRDGGGR